MTSAILVAAGSSRRMGFDKLAADLAGLPVAAWSLRALAQCPDIDEILIVTAPDRIPAFQHLAHLAGAQPKLRAILPGGAERCHSVWAGLQAVHPETQFIIVHDAARPLATPATFSACLALARRTGAATCATPVPDTLKRAAPASDSADVPLIGESIDRTAVWAIQTPQAFAAPPLLAAYRAALASGQLLTDETSALQNLGHPVALHDPGHPNFKITWPADLAHARLLLAAERISSPPPHI